MSIYAQIFIAGSSVSSGHDPGEKIISGSVYIGIYDAATGKLTNGNGISVTYQPVLNSVPGDEVTVQVIGQSLKIYTGLLSSVVTGGTREEIYSARVISYAGAVPLTPTSSPLICDLVINNINQDKKESAPGAGDGQATVNASSTNGPIQYSLDNINFQSSPIFTGLSAGPHTVYAKDGADCTDSKAFNIEVIANLLTGDPSFNNSGNVCRWNAAFNPIFFTYQRRDFEVSNITGNGNGYAIVSVNANINGVIVGDLVYIKAGKLDGAYTITAMSGNNLTIDGQFIDNATQTGFININRLRPYYYIQTEITYWDKLKNKYQQINATNRPDSSGLVRADLSNFLQSIVSVKDESNYTAINFRDDNLSASYTVRFAEIWDGNTPSYVSLDYNYYVLFAAKQLGSHGGGNLTDYVPFKLNSASTKWISDFKEPAYSYGYPFDLSFIYGENLAGEQLYYKIILLDINRNPLSVDAITSYLLNEDSSYLLNEDNSRLVIARQELVNTPVAEHIGLNRLLMNTQYSDDAWYFKIALFYDQDEVPKQVMEYQTVRIDKALDKNSVYLRWIGLSGSWNYYRFIYNQEYSLDVQNASIIKNYVSDWANQDTIEDVISKQAGQKLKVMAEDLSVNDIKGLQSIKYSPKVQILVGQNPVKWQTVTVNTATFSEYETINQQAPFSIIFNLPGINVQMQ